MAVWLSADALDVSTEAPALRLVRDTIPRAS